jgi:hypothetical protein
MALQRQKPHSKHLDIHRKSREKRRKMVLGHYGNKCAYCGEKHYEFLAIDHVNNDGADHKRMLGSKSNDSVLLDIIKQGYPDTFQILCHNCNSAKQYYKRNPIIEERQQLQITEGFMGEGI